MITTPSPGQRAIHAVEKVLADHRRAMSNTGSGVACTCGEHFRTVTGWDHHRADLATNAAAEHLTPPPPP